MQLLSHGRQVVILHTHRNIFHPKVKFIQCKTWIFTLQHKLLSFWKHSIKFCTPTLITLVIQHGVSDTLIFFVEGPKTCLKMLFRKSIFCTMDCKEDALLNPLKTHAITTTETLPRYTLIQKAKSHQTEDPNKGLETPSLPQCSRAVILKEY